MIAALQWKVMGSHGSHATVEGHESTHGSHATMEGHWSMHGSLATVEGQASTM